MNTWSFPPSEETKKQTDPLLFTNYEMNRGNFENADKESVPNQSIQQKESINSDKGQIFFKDLNYEGQRTNELKSITYKDGIRDDKQIIHDNNDNKNDEENINNPQENLDEDEYDKINLGKMGGNCEENEEDDIYYISQFIPPQNFSVKLRNAKDEYEKLKREIEKLKRENKKFNPKFNMERPFAYNPYIP